MKCINCGKEITEGYTWEDEASFVCDDSCLKATGLTETEINADINAGVVYWASCSKKQNNEKKMLRLTACGLTADLRPNVVVADFEQGTSYPLWHYTTFIRVEDALEYLKDLYRDGIDPDDVNKHKFWLSLDELREACN